MSDGDDGWKKRRKKERVGGEGWGVEQPRRLSHSLPFLMAKFVVKSRALSDEVARCSSEKCKLVDLPGAPRCHFDSPLGEQWPPKS